MRTMHPASHPAAPSAPQPGLGLPGSADRRRASLAGALLLLAVALALFGWPAWQQQQARARGAALFEGRSPLAGTLPGHVQALPTEATRCVNCHTGLRPAGGLLDAARLARPQARRGGPASRYDAASLCQLLRSGTDPAHVIIDATMPRYQADDRQCADLWAHLTGPG